jgi:hypothetical protein
MCGENPTGGDNQQGRPRCSLTPDYVAGFVDGEGCFCVSIHPHPTVRSGRGWLIAPAFQAYQHRDNVGILEQLRGFFGCGSITSKGPNSSVMTFSVYRQKDMQSVIITFFERYTMLSKKHEDFVKFGEVVRLLESKAHRTETGFMEIAKIAFSMNQHGKQRKYTLEEVLAEPSETARRALAHRASEDTVRSLRRRREGGRNDHPTDPGTTRVGGNRDA